MKYFSPFGALPLAFATFLLTVSTFAFPQNAAPAEAANSQQMGADLKFIDSMVEHHKSGIAMAEMAEKRAKSKELRKLAKKMERGQQKDIRKMNRWRSQWFRDAPQASMPMDPSPMQKLTDAAAADFDRIFAETMIAHHRQAIDMSQQMMPMLKKQQLKTLASKGVQMQKSEIEALRPFASK